MESELSNAEVPSFIYGTAWKENDTEDLTRLALETGFRAIDTANQRKHYHEAGVGNALISAREDGLVERSDVFLQTKYTYPAGQDHRMPYDEHDDPETQVRDSLNSSLEHLRTEYVDALILHGPSTRRGLAEVDRTVWRTMEELSRAESVRSIGVSNVSARQLELFLEFAEVKPRFVQNRCFARDQWGRECRDICSSNGIDYQGFSLLTANQRELQSETVRSLAEKYDRTIPQIVFRFARQLGMITLTGTTSEKHMTQDLAIDEFELTEDDVARMETIA